MSVRLVNGPSCGTFPVTVYCVAWIQSRTYVRDTKTKRNRESATCKSSDQTRRPPHLVFVPFLARSHFGPLAACGDEGTTASILTTPHFAALAPPSVPVHVAPLRSPVAHDDFSLLPDDDASSAQAALSPALASLLRAHAATAVAVVSDAVLYWSPRVARQCGTPHATFHTVGAFSAAAMVAVHLHRPKEFTEPFPVPGGFPRPVTLRAAQVNEAALAHLPVFCAAAFNSFSAMEAEFAEYYRGQLVGRPKNVFLVGPTPATAVINGNAERDPILKWLDARPARSVVYVCFGSTCALLATQLRALAAGLRACGHPFLWVIPTTNSTDGIDAEERASSHGMVVAGRWAPQANVLAHRAVGGFVVHCSWNSVTEAVSAGVPLATWPLRAEQFLNEAFLVEVVRVGVRVREVADREREDVVPAEAVARAVRRLMGGDEGDVATRARASELGVAARVAVAEGGSSCGDWARLMEELKAFYHHAASLSDY